MKNASVLVGQVIMLYVGNSFAASGFKIHFSLGYPTRLSGIKSVHPEILNSRMNGGCTGADFFVRNGKKLKIDDKKQFICLKFN